MADVKYLPEFKRALKKYGSIKDSVKRKIDNLLQSPLNFGEQLKYELTGLDSCPIKRNFILIYVYCRECRIKGHQEINACADCVEILDETVKILTFAPHDLAYKIARKIKL